MIVMLVLFGLGLALEATLYALKRSQRWRIALALPAIVVTMAAAGALLVLRPSLWSGLLVLTSLYRTGNMLRVIEARMHERYLRQATRRTGLMLLGWQAVIVLAWVAWAHWHTTGHATWDVVTAVQLIVAGVLLLSTIRSLRRTSWPPALPAKSMADSSLPTITIAIPARNETDDLQACLGSIIANDYPKLEILVLDDCSQNRRTPEIIRSFAHDGVRFIQGEGPHDTWLPKNQAYHRLAAEASGSYILFCGVDVRFAPDSIRRIITTMLANHKQMLSILPQRAPGTATRLSLIQAMRYWWELAPPRRIFNRPPVLSSCWVIQSGALKHAGGFAAVSRSIVPEAYFAKHLLPEDGYSFRRAGETLGVASVKSAAEQRATAIRTRYPQLHRRPEHVLASSVVELFTLVLPFVLALGGAWLSIGPGAWSLSVAACTLLIITHALVVQATRINPWWSIIFSLPPMALIDITLLHYSMWQYEFSTVSWKGRNVCVPVMHVVPHLPPIR